MRDYLLRKDQVQAARSAAACEECGHAHREHREYAPTFELVDGEIVEVEHEKYEAGLFACHVDGCDCEIRA